MMLTWLVLAAYLLPSSLGMNPMSLYVDQPEGVTMYTVPSQGKFFACYTLVGGTYKECDTLKNSRSRQHESSPQEAPMTAGSISTFSSLAWALARHNSL